MVAGSPITSHAHGIRSNDGEFTPLGLKHDSLMQVFAEANPDRKSFVPFVGFCSFSV